jgi:hypothetical protein
MDEVFLKSLLGQGFTVVILVLGIYYLAREFKAERMENRAELKGLLTRYESLVVEQAKLFQKVADALERENEPR